MNKPTEEQQEDYSRDADQTRYLIIVGIIAGGTLVGLFALEIIAIFVDVETAFVFTPEIVHTLIPVTVGGLSALGGFLYGREAGKRMMTGNGTSTTNPQETDKG